MAPKISNCALLRLSSVPLALLGGVMLATAAVAGSAESLPAEQAIARIEAGRALAFDRKKGNCLACHHIEGGELAGNTAPPLVAMQARFPDRNKLVAQIVDARTNNPLTLMPPFGAHGILSTEEIDLLVDFLYSL
mgnify:FL=1